MQETQDLGIINIRPITVTLLTKLEDYTDLFNKTKASRLLPH